MYDPFNNDLVYSSMLKRDYTNVQHDEDVVSETRQLLIRSPDHYSQPQQQQQQPMFDVHTPFKRFKQEEPTLDYLLTDPTSALANIKLETVFNIEEFQHLPTETQNELTKLLPMVDVALPSYSSSASSSSASLPLEDPSPSLHPSFFSKSDNPIFWSVLDDWQTMLSNGDMLPTTSTSSITPSTLSNPSSTTPAPPSFKDEAFETYWGELNEKDKMHNVAGDSKSITLKDMCRKGLIRENDIIVYKRNFSACKVIVSKSMKVVKADGTLGLSIILDDQIFEDFETPTALETKILDQHGKVSRDRRPNGNAFKSIRLIRNGKDLGRLFDIRKDAFGS